MSPERIKDAFLDYF